MTDKRQISAKTVKLVLKPEEQATIRAIRYIEEHRMLPEQKENYGDWEETVGWLAEQALIGPDQLQEAMIRAFKADQRLMNAYASYAPAQTPEQTDPRIISSKNGKPRFRALTMAELRQVKRSHWIVNGILLERTVSMLYGDANTGKTFVALAMALCLAYGREWLGRPVRSAMKVLYIYGEGDAGLRDRVEAWKQFHEVNEDTDNFIPIPFPVQALVERDILAETIEDYNGVDMIVFDTFSMCSEGIDENSNKDVAQWLASAHYLKNTYNCQVMIVHHVGKSGDYRGASAFRGNVDTMIMMDSPQNEPITVSCTKQRDKKKFDNFYLELREIYLGLDEDTGESITSCVVVISDRSEQIKEGIIGEQTTLLKILACNPDISENKWKEEAKAQGIGGRTFDARKQYMLENGIISVTPGAKGKAKKFTIAPEHMPVIASGERESEAK